MIFAHRSLRDGYRVTCFPENDRKLTIFLPGEGEPTHDPSARRERTRKLTIFLPGEGEPTHDLSLMGQVARAIRYAPLASEADQRDVMTGTKAMRAALRLRDFRSWDAEILNNEDIVLGVTPAGQSDDQASPPKEAGRSFTDWTDKISAIIDLMVASSDLGPVEGRQVTEAVRYRPGTAFIMMSMDKSQPELTDVSDAVKEVFAQFDIHAVRADDIQHEDLITARILTEIRVAEFCFADLSGGRPNVYYEVGYAHALARRVMLYRKAGTGLHFDLVGIIALSTATSGS